jgi:hypothetical protein
MYLFFIDIKVNTHENVHAYIIALSRELIPVRNPAGIRPDSGRNYRENEKIFHFSEERFI